MVCRAPLVLTGYVMRIDPGGRGLRARWRGFWRIRGIRVCRCGIGAVRSTNLAVRAVLGVLAGG